MFLKSSCVKRAPIATRPTPPSTSAGSAAPQIPGVGSGTGPDSSRWCMVARRGCFEGAAGSWARSSADWRGARTSAGSAAPQIPASGSGVGSSAGGGALQHGRSQLAALMKGRDRVNYRMTRLRSRPPHSTWSHHVCRNVPRTALCCRLRHCALGAC